MKVGLLHLLLQHTSASLTLNENCDPTVRYDMEQYFLNAVPDNAPYEHDYEALTICRRTSNHRCLACR
ncbi:thiamin phosphate synthase [Klebsiella pneumoniae]|uniref:Thiamin phosphate synthase n=1 Tax=Klebsiella pneumoniae TaxID=573 RepID=A0A377ZPS9_KLEPN|nr:thiamin phosphate synthase [Klebsiella pneumoniae]